MPLIPNSQFLVTYALHLADNALILGQRNAEWCGHGPVPEQDIAITNISLDLIGQARNFYQYAALLKADGSTEDTLVGFRQEAEFRNCLLVEQPNGDWAQTILRQYLFSNYQYILYRELQKGRDQQLAAIAAKALKEVTYHLRWSSEWVIRLGDGTEESQQRMLQALDQLWMYTGELFLLSDFESSLVEKGKAIDVSLIKEEWTEKVKEILSEANLPMPDNNYMQTGGKEGHHSEFLGHILSELQYMQKTYPGAEW